MKEIWDYPVELQQLKVIEGDAICQSRIATVDTESKSILGLVGNRFRLIQNRQLVEAMDSIKTEEGLELENTHVCKSRRVAIFDYAFKNKEATIEGSTEPNDKIGFRLQVINSFTPDFAGQIRITAKRLACLNGMTLPKSLGQVAFKQLEIVNSEALQTVIQSRIAPAIETARTWSQWASQIPDNTKVTELIRSRLSKKAAEELQRQYNESKDKSIWGLYNLVTFFISHTAKARNASDTPIKQLELGNLERDFYSVNLN